MTAILRSVSVFPDDLVQPASGLRHHGETLAGRYQIEGLAHPVQRKDRPGPRPAKLLAAQIVGVAFCAAVPIAAALAAMALASGRPLPRLPQGPAGLVLAVVAVPLMHVLCVMLGCLLGGDNSPGRRDTAPFPSPQMNRYSDTSTGFFG